MDQLDVFAKINNLHNHDLIAAMRFLNREVSGTQYISVNLAKLRTYELQEMARNLVYRYSEKMGNDYDGVWRKIEAEVETVNAGRARIGKPRFGAPVQVVPDPVPEPAPQPQVAPQPQTLPTTVDPTTLRHYVYEEIVWAITKRLNVYLVGPAGCGKTHLAEQVAEHLDLPFGFSGAVSSEFKLIGFKDAHGNYHETSFFDRYKNGGLFLKDEIDASCAAALLALNAGIANGKQDFPCGIIKKHVDFRLIAAANTYGHGADRQYVGRNQLDAATLDRFYVIPMDYDEALELALFGNHEWVRYVHRARKACRQLGNIRHVISMRAIVNGLEMCETPIPRSRWEYGALWKGLPNDDVLKIKRQMGV